MSLTLVHVFLPKSGKLIVKQSLNWKHFFFSFHWNLFKLWFPMHKLSKIHHMFILTFISILPNQIVTLWFSFPFTHKTWIYRPINFSWKANNRLPPHSIIIYYKQFHNISSLRSKYSILFFSVRIDIVIFFSCKFAINKRQNTNYSFLPVTSKVSCIRRKRGQIICLQGNNKSMVIFVPIR
jgi:hypothetical protein